LTQRPAEKLTSYYTAKPAALSIHLTASSIYKSNFIFFYTFLTSPKNFQFHSDNKLKENMFKVFFYRAEEEEGGFLI